VTVTDAGDWRGGDWADDNTIVFQSDVGHAALSRVSADGGSPQPFVDARDIAGSIRWPQFLPGGKGLLYTVGVAGSFEAGTVMAQALPNGKPQVVFRNAYYGRYVTGHVLYMHQGTLFAAPFNITRLEATGAAVPVVEGVSGNYGTGSGEFAVSRTGVLVYVPNVSEHVLSLMNRSGAVTPFRAVHGIWTNPAFSPRGERLALEVSDGTGFSVWVYDLARDTRTKLTSDDTRFSRPVWSPDGNRLVFSLYRDGRLNLYWARADGASGPQRLTNSDKAQEACSWHPGGKLIAYAHRGPSERALMVLPITGDDSSGWKAGEPQTFLSAPHNLFDPMFSPDGRWIAYTSDETGREEVFVRPFPGPGPQALISSGGGRNPQWSPSTRELLYRGADNRIMAAAYAESGDSFIPEKPVVWSPRALTPGIMRPLQQLAFAVHPDGQHVALFVPPAAGPGLRDKVVLVTNFFDELTRYKAATR
jgi:serine/threonine-protein kinase